MQTEKLVLTEIRDQIGILTLNRPALHNAIDMAMILAIEAAFMDLDADPEVRVIVVTGAGSKAFMAGGDIADLNSRRGLAHYLEFAETVHRVFRRFELSDKPNIAAINGYALGGGLEMCLAMDMRIMAANARIGLTEIVLGLFPGGGGTQRLPRQIAACSANELMFTGDHIGADEALRLGIVNRVVQQDELMDATMALATKIASRSPLVLKLLKRTIQEGRDMPLGPALAHERAMISLVRDTEDSVEGCAAFLEKRQPKFDGR